MSAGAVATEGPHTSAKRESGPRESWGGVATVLLAVAACGAPRHVEVRDLRAFEAIKGGTGALFATITNPTDSAERLDSVTSPAASHISAHTSREENGLVVMSEMTDLSIGAHDSLVFAPGAAHLMFEDLPAALTAGDTVAVTFWFHRAGAMPVMAHVRRYGS